MRAVTASGMIFVGPAMGGTAAKEEPFKARVIKSNAEVQRERKNFQKALTEKREYWQNEIEQWVDEFGEAALGKLMELGGER